MEWGHSAMRLPPSILLLLAVCACGGAPARAADPQPPPAVARDLETLNRMRQQRTMSAPRTSSPAAPLAAPPPAPAVATPQPVQPVRAAQPAAEPDAAAIARLIAALDDDAKETREQARRDLVEIGPPAVEELIDALDDGELRVRIGAAEALGALKDPRAAEPLVELFPEPSRELWGAVFHALSAIGSPAVPALLDGLENTDSNARWKAVHLLGAIRAPGAAETLVALLNKDRSTGVRVEIAAALGKIKDRTACDALLDALHDW